MTQALDDDNDNGKEIYQLSQTKNNNYKAI